MKKAALIFAVVILVAGGFVFVHHTRVKAAQPCWSKLMNIASAKDQWALEKGAKPGATVTVDDILPYLGSMPTCQVAGATYIIGKIGEAPRCTVHGAVSDFKPDRY